jgi:hypothetical protein
VIPVVLNRGGVTDIVKHKHTGFLAADAEAVAELTAQVFGLEEEALGGLRRAATSWVERFSQKAFAKNFRILANRGVLTKPFRFLQQQTQGGRRQCFACVCRLCARKAACDTGAGRVGAAVAFGCSCRRACGGDAERLGVVTQRPARKCCCGCYVWRDGICMRSDVFWLAGRLTIPFMHMQMLCCPAPSSCPNDPPRLPSSLSRASTGVGDWGRSVLVGVLAHAGAPCLCLPA